MTDLPPVLAASPWRTNANLILDVARLGYITTEDRTLDPTWGRGGWWTCWRPTDLVAHDLYTFDGVDFRNLPEEDDTFDVAAYDPPYVCKGGRETTTMPDFQDRYGMTDAPRTPWANQVQMNQGLTEMARVVRSRGIILMKCQDYIWSGKLQPGTYWTLEHAIGTLDLTLVDRLEHYGTAPRPQPPGRRQVHARRNLSTLFVFQT